MSLFRVFTQVCFFALSVVFLASFAEAAKPTTLIYRLSQFITLTLVIDQQNTGTKLHLVLNDSRPVSSDYPYRPQNWRLDTIDLGFDAHLEKLEILKPNFMTENPDESLVLRESGDLLRNLRLGGYFMLQMTTSDSIGPIDITTLYPLKEILSQQILKKFSFSSDPAQPGVKRFVSARRVIGPDRERALVTIADVTPDGRFKHGAFLGDDKSHMYHHVDGRYMDLYAMNGTWGEFGRTLHLDGEGYFVTDRNSSLAYIKLSHLRPGIGLFPRFPYSLHPMGTRNLISGLDEIIPRPQITPIVNENGVPYLDKEGQVIHQPKVPMENYFRVSRSANIAEAMEKAAAEHHKLESEGFPPVTLNTKAASDYYGLMGRIAPPQPRSCALIFAR